MTEQAMVIDALGVTPDFNVTAEARQRIDFLDTYLRASGLSTYVLGISGGVDSLAAALLAQRAIEELRDAGHAAKFLAVRLRYGVRAGEHDAQKALKTIRTDEVFTVDIKPAADAMLNSIKRAAGTGR